MNFQSLKYTYQRQKKKQHKRKLRKLQNIRSIYKIQIILQLKIAEANFNSDTTELAELHKQYDSVILQRKGWREAINRLEAN